MKTSATNLMSGHSPITEAPMPSNIDAAHRIFACKAALGFHPSGSLSPASKKETAKINWDTPRRPVQSKYNDLSCQMRQHDGTDHAIAHGAETPAETGAQYITPTAIPTERASIKNNKETFKLYKLAYPCGENYYVPKHSAKSAT